MTSTDPAAALQDFVHRTAAELDVTGVSVGLLLDDEEHYAFHGVTSVENPLEVDDQTLFQFGSTGKTYTATAMMRLVDQGKVDLNAPVRTYVPELRLQDEDVAREVTVLQLFNHTAGWQGDLMENTGDGDDALARYVELMADLTQAYPLGATVSYNNASLSLAGRVIEKVTGTTYEQAVRDLLLTPLGMTNTFFFPGEIISRRFAVGHNRAEDGTVTVTRPWAMARGNSPAGGMSATAADQLRWARFHLGDGCAADGTRLLSAELLASMQQPTQDIRGSALGDYVGISWLLRDLDGVRLVGHGGTTNGQYSEFVMVPERRFALASMTNSGPTGPQFNQLLERWALEHFLGLAHTVDVPREASDAELAEYAGRYETIAVVCDISVVSGRLSVQISLTPQTAAAMLEAGETPPAQPPMLLALVGESGDRFVIPEGPAEGMKGYFTRSADGRVEGVHLGGRLATRAAVSASA